MTSVRGDDDGDVRVFLRHQTFEAANLSDKTIYSSRTGNTINNQFLPVFV